MQSDTAPTTFTNISVPGSSSTSSVSNQAKFLEEEIVQTQVSFVKGPTYKIGNREFDLILTVTYLTQILILTVVFIVFGWFKNKAFLFFYIILILGILGSVFATPAEITNVNSELNSMLIKSQHAMALMGPFCLLLAYGIFFPFEYDKNQIALLIIIIIIVVMSNIFLESKQTSLSFYTIAAFKKMLMNTALILFIMFLLNIKLKDNINGMSLTFKRP